jgi:GR25 family glycosyltransferase involved in LPS biosynthesis
LKNKICYKIFHIENEQNSSRNECFEKIKSQIDLNEINSPTVFMDNPETFKSFIKENPSFNIHPDGHNPWYNRAASHYDRERSKPYKGWIFQEIGIWASSFLAYEEFLKSDYDYLLIFEDDLLIKDNFLELVEKYMQELPENWDIFYIYHPMPPLKVGEKVSENLSTPFNNWSNACYIISRAGVLKTMELIKKESIFLPIDWYFLKQPDIYNIYVIQQGKDQGCKLKMTESTYWKRPVKFVNLRKYMTE